MAKVTGGEGMNFSGSVGAITYSQQPDGSTTAKKKQGPRTTPLTIPQLSVIQDTGLRSPFLRAVKDFIDVGFELQGKIDKMNTNNVGVRLVNKAMAGEYPERRIDYSKVMLTKGKMETPQQAAVNLTESGVTCTWSTEMQKGEHYTDQIMIVAYFPDLKKAAFHTAGAQRHHGNEHLSLAGVPHGHSAEIYMSFIKNNRKGISDSIYLGQLIW